MGKIFCLIILESGLRRKLKLNNGTYDELMAGLAGIVEVDSDNTEVQMYDTDLDDLVDLLPGDTVPNKAKIYVSQKTATNLRTPDDNALPQSTFQILEMAPVAMLELFKQESEQPNVTLSSGSSSAVSEDASSGEISLDAPDAGDQTNDCTMEASEQAMEDEQQADETTSTVVAKVESGGSENPVTSQSDPCVIFGNVISPSEAAKIQDLLNGAPLSGTLRGEQEVDRAESSVHQETTGNPEPIQDVKDATAIEQWMINLLLEIRQQQRDCMHQVQQIRHRMLLLLERTPHSEAAGAQASTSAAGIVVLPTLPAHTLDELDAAEAAMEDRNVADALRRRLLQLSGMTMREVGSRVMTAIMGNKVQQQFSLHGRKGKRAFLNMKLCTVATDAICKKLGVDLGEALGFIQRWLPGAIDRGGGRKRRLTETS
ncbi:uncharacterized protein LOC144101451 isoform X1 [Amblyomma americanum]